jgi:RHS repeat-associated protein
LIAEEGYMLIRRFAKLLLPLIGMIVALFTTITPSFAEPFDCDQLNTTFSNIGSFSFFRGPTAIPGGPFGIRSSNNVGVIGIGDMAGQTIASVTPQFVSGNEFRVTVRPGGSISAKFLVQCRLPNNTGTAIYGAPINFTDLGVLSPSTNISFLQLIESTANQNVYRVGTTGVGATVIHSHFIRTTEFVEPSGGFFGDPGGPIHPVHQFTTRTIPLVAGPPPIVANPKQPEQNGSGPGINPSTGCPAKTGDPCDVFNGNYYHEETDLLVQGIMPVRLLRAYYSGKSAFVGDFGVGSHLVGYNYHLNIPQNSNNEVILVPNTQLQFNTGNDSQIVFTNPNGGPVFVNNSLLGTTGDILTLSVDPNNHLAGAEYRNLEHERLLFNADGWLIASEDPNGNRLEYNRDSNGKLLQVTEVSTGRNIHFTYDSNGLISQAADHTGRTVSYNYSDAKELLTVTSPDNHSMTYAWDGEHRIISKTDYNGQTKMTNTYGPDSAVTKQTQAYGQDILIESVSETVRKVTDPNSHVTTYTFNEQGLPVEVEDALGNKVKTHFSPNMFTANTNNRFVETEDSLGRVTHVVLNERNLPTSITDPLGQQTSLVYDPVHLEKPKTVTDPKGQKAHFEYDIKGNLTKVTDNAGNATTFTYNVKGQVLTVTDPLGQVTSFAYNAQNDLASVTNPLGHKTEYTYDTLSRITKIKDPKGNESTMAYDALDRLIAVTDALSHTSTFSYDANGNRLSSTDPRGNTSTAVYDEKDRLVSATNAKGETYSYQYDGADNLVSVTDPKGQVTTHILDAADRVTKITFQDGTEYNYSYDPASQLTSVSDGTGTWSYSYDLLGRVTVENTPQGSLSYAYDANSNLTQMSSAGYGTVNYGYDNLDRVVSIVKDGKTYSYNYDPLGRRTGLERPNGVTSTYEYDAGSRLSALTHSKGTTVLEKHDYTYDANGNIIRQVKAGGPYGDITKDYTYDPLNRLTQVDALGVLASSQFKNSGQMQAALRHLSNVQKITNPTARQQQLSNAVKEGAVLPENARWTFDENGNIASKSVLDWSTGQYKTRILTYDEADRLVGITKPDGAVTLNYDANGNLVSDSTGRQFTWNAQDQLTRLQTPQSTADFRYDPQGRRIRLERGSTLKTYFYQGLDMLSDSASKFLHGAGIDEPLEINSPTLNANYLTDHLGSTSQLLDATTALSKARLDYKSYGKLEGDVSNPASANPFTYTGREDDGTGLMYYRARYYDPELEVFIAQDPLGSSQRYANSNPVRYIDSLGLWHRDSAGNLQPDTNAEMLSMPWTAQGTEDETADAALTVLPIGRVGKACALTGSALVKTSIYGTHVLERMAERGITKKMVETALSKGTQYWDPKNNVINYVLQDGFASGKSLLVGQNPITGKVTTVIRGNNLVRTRFIPIK